MVGGEIGYRGQSANRVFGLEGQGNWADFKHRCRRDQPERD
jgi:hypothetical protein